MVCGYTLSPKACYGKALARAKARIASRKTGEVIRPYRCACGWWHLGHERRDHAVNVRRAENEARLTAAFKRQGVTRG